MLLSCRFLTDVSNINSFEYASAAEIAEGDDQTLYFQLVDSSVDRPEQGFQPSGRRYVPADGATLTVTFVNVDDAKQFIRSADHPYEGDTSIWSVPLLSTDPLKGTTSLKMVLTQDTSKLNISMMPGVLLRIR